jgi:hypothetical protein
MLALVVVVVLTFSSVLSYFSKFVIDHAFMPNHGKLVAVDYSFVVCWAPALKT